MHLFHGGLIFSAYKSWNKVIFLGKTGWWKINFACSISISSAFSWKKTHFLRFLEKTYWMQCLVSSLLPFNLPSNFRMHLWFLRKSHRLLHILKCYVLGKSRPGHWLSESIIVVEEKFCNEWISISFSATSGMNR